MSDGGPLVVRRLAALLGLIVLGGVALGLIGWAAMGALPESDAPDPDTEVELGDPALDAAGVIEVEPARPGDAAIDITRCEIDDGLVQVGGTLENTSGAAQAFVVHVGVLFDGVLFDGLTAQVSVATIDDGAASDWEGSAGSVDPEDDTQHDPECQVDRVGLAEEPDG